MDPYAAMSSVQAGCSSDGLRSALAVGPSLQHKSSLATTRSTSSTSASSSSHHSFANLTGAVGAAVSSSPSSSTRPLQPSMYTETVQSPKTRTFEKPARLPIHVRIVPKDIWLRIHVEPSHTIGSIKDTALFKANAPDYDPSLSYRFYQDAVNASAHAKIAPVASHDKVVKHRTYALPRSIACPPPDLSDLAASLAASVAGTNRFNRRPSRSNLSPAFVARSAQPPPVPPLPNFDSAYSPRQSQVALPSPSTLQYDTTSPRSRSIPRSLSSHALGTAGSPARSASSGDVIGSPPAPVTRQISTSTLATSPPSASSDWGATSNVATMSSDASASETSHSHSSSAIEEIAIRLDASLVTGDRNAKLEEAQARFRLSQWHARRESADTSTPAQRQALLSTMQMDSSPRRQSSPAHSCNSTPTIASSSTFDSEAASSPRMNAVSPSSFNASSAGSHASPGYAASPRADSLHPSAATPPRRPIRINPGSTASTAPPAIFYTQPGACESFNSLASLDSPSSASAALMTTQDDDTSIMRWGTQAEAAPLSDEPSSPSLAPSSTLAALSSPVQPSEALLSGSPSSATSPLRPRSKTVTAADVLRSRSARDDVPPPMMPDAISSPVRNSSLPKTNIRKLVPETSQRRDGPQMELLDMLKGGPGGVDDDEGFSTVKQRNVRQAMATPPILRKRSSGDAAAAPSSPFAAASSADTRDLYIAGIRLDEISRGVKDAFHPLSAKYAVLSSANGCELDEWKTVAAYRIRPYELLELQWSIPTERVYIPPISLHETLRVGGASSGGHKGMFDRTWGDDQDAGPDVDAPCLEPYFEGWVYVLKNANAGKASAKRSTKMGKWKLHWLTVRGWRMDLYRKKPRAGEAVMPDAEQVWPLRSVEWVMEDGDNAVPGCAALPALDAMPRSSITAGFSAKAGTGTSAAGEVSMLTMRCVTNFDHQALSMLLLRAWFRCSATRSSVGTDNWRRKAVFRAMVAGRGGTAAPGRAGRGGRGGRNAKSRMRLRPSGWAKEWEDADQWSSDSEREEVGAPAELEHMVLAQQQQERRNTVTQAKADDGARQKGKQGKEAEVRGIVPNGLYAALLGRTTGSSGNAASSASGDGPGGGGSLDASPHHRGTARQRHLAQSPSLPHMEPGLMLGSTSQYSSRRHSNSMSRSPSRSHGRGSSPEPWVAQRSSAARGRSTPGSMHSSASSRNVSREASPMPSRKGSASGGSVHSDPYAMSPALVPGFVDAQPPPSVMLLKRFKASQERAKGANSDT